MRGRRLSGRPRPPTGFGGGERGGGEGWGGLSAVPPRPPGAAARGGGLAFPVPGGKPLTVGGVLFPRLPSALGRRALAQVLAWVPCSPRHRRAVPAGRGGGGSEGRCVLRGVVRVSG